MARLLSVSRQCVERNGLFGNSNILILWDAVITRRFGSQRWLTSSRRCCWRACAKGERGTTVCYADRFIPKEERTRASDEGDEPNARPIGAASAHIAQALSVFDETNKRTCVVDSSR